MSEIERQVKDTMKKSGNEDVEVETEVYEVPKNLTLGKGYLRNASFRCALCLNLIIKGNRILAHFRNKHKITKPGAVEKLVVLGAVEYEPTAVLEEPNYPIPGRTPYKRLGLGEIVVARVPGHPWWPGIVEKKEYQVNQSRMIDIRFFDCGMTVASVEINNVKDAHGYGSYLKAKRRVLSAQTMSSLRQAWEFVMEVESTTPEWRHDYFARDKNVSTRDKNVSTRDKKKKDMFDFLIDKEKALAKKPVSKPARPSKKNPIFRRITICDSDVDSEPDPEPQPTPYDDENEDVEIEVEFIASPKINPQKKTHRTPNQKKLVTVKAKMNMKKKRSKSLEIVHCKK